MIEQLVAILEQTFKDLTAEEIADILWLTLQQWQSTAATLPKTQPGVSDSEPPIVEIVPPDNAPVIPPRPETPPSVPVPRQPKMAGLTTSRPQPKPQSQAKSTLGAPLAIPDAPALRSSQEILKAVRPLIRRVPSSQVSYLDVPATVQAIAKTDLWTLKLQPILEPWLELAIVVDATPSMVIWQRTILSLRRVLAQSGVFRDVRMWSLETQDSPNLSTNENSPELKLCIRSGFGPAAALQPPCRPQELLDPNGRRLIVVISDCIAPRWDTQPIRDMLQVWAGHGPMALVQVLPEWLWNRTALSEVVKGQVFSHTPGQSNQSLTFVRRERWRRNIPVGVKVPVLTLEPAVARRWSQMVAGKAAVSAPGLLFSSVSSQGSSLKRSPDSKHPSFAQSTLTPQQRLEQFRNFSSPMARRLAGLLAACPEVNLPIVRMVQAALLPDAQQVHVAEVLLGGLFKPQTEITAHTPADQVQYVFHDDVQPLVQDTVPPDRAFAALSTWLNHRFGYSLANFRAYVTPERIEQVKPFAGILLDVLKRRGDEYAEIVNSIERIYQPQYTTFTELTQNEAATQDYEIRSRVGSSGIAVIAIHGGNLQPGTTEIAEAVAGDIHSFYSFVSLKPEIDQTLYIPSPQFDEPIAVEIVSEAQVVLSIHGCQGKTEFIKVGGLDTDRRDLIKAELQAAGFSVSDDEPGGTNPANICNRNRTGQGVQIEISRGLRKRFINSVGNIQDVTGFNQFVDILQRCLQVSVITGGGTFQSEITILEPPFPELKTLEFETASLVKTSDVDSDLRKFFQATDPGKALAVDNPEDKKYYIDFSSVRGGEIIKKLKQKITFFSPDAPTCVLFTGHIGCGKSTELMRLRTELEQEGFQVVYFESSEDLEMTDVDISDVLLAIARRVSQSLDKLLLGEPSRLKELLQGAAKVLNSDVTGMKIKVPGVGDVGVTSEKEKFSLAFGIGEITTKAKSDATLREKLNQYLGPQKTQLLEAINQELLEPAIAKLKQLGKKGLVVIVDNLDRIDNRQKGWGRPQQEYLFVDQGECLTKLRCHLVYTMPLALKFSNDYGNLTQRFSEDPKVLPMVPVQLTDGSQCEAGMALLRQMVLARAFPDMDEYKRLDKITEIFDSSETLDRLCSVSGGHVRDLLRLLNTWIKKGRQLPLSREALEEVIRSRRNEMTMPISDREWELLRQVRQRKKVSDDDGYQTLIRSRLVFEYRDKGESWFDINPILAEARELQP